MKNKFYQLQVLPEREYYGCKAVSMDDAWQILTALARYDGYPYQKRFVRIYKESRIIVLYKNLQTIINEDIDVC